MSAVEQVAEQLAMLSRSGDCTMKSRQLARELRRLGFKAAPIMEVCQHTAVEFVDPTTGTRMIADPNSHQIMPRPARGWAGVNFPGLRHVLRPQWFDRIRRLFCQHQWLPTYRNGATCRACGAHTWRAV